MVVAGLKLLFSFCRSQPDKKFLIGRALLLGGPRQEGFGGFRFAGRTAYLVQRRSYCSTRVKMSDTVRGKFRLAVIQMEVGADKDENLTKATLAIDAAAKKGAKIIGLPECFNSPYGIQYFKEYAENIPDGPTAQLMASLAQKFNVYIVAGSIPERGDDSKLYNTCMIFGPSGSLLATHRKVHLFDIDVPGRMTFQESKVLTRGETLTIVDTEYCRLGIGICYDMRFPEMAQIYRENDCDLLMYPGAFNLTTGPAHWKILQQGRAVDNQIYVATIAPARDVKASYVAWGHSMIVDPWGKILAEADEKETTLIKDIDLNYLKEVRQQIPVSYQKRSDLYKLKTVKEIELRP